jgi:uncharacterized membrane protein (DUF106 family)
MDYSNAIFYLALLLVAGCVTELYVRITGKGEKAGKIHGQVIPNKRNLHPPVVLLVAAIIIAAISISR